MAQVQYNGGLPTVAPDATPPMDYQNIRATPDAFGAGVAKSLQSLGDSAGKDIQLFHQVAADQNVNNYLTGSHDILFGTGQKNPDGTVDTGFYGTKGQDAMQAMPQATQALQNLRQKLSDQLTDPVTKLKFDSDTRRMEFYLQNEMGRHYDQQSQVWAVNTNKQGYENSIQMAAMRPGDADAGQIAFNQAMQYRTKLLQAQGIATPETMTNLPLEVHRDITQQQVQTLLGRGDSIGAKQLLDSNRQFVEGAPWYATLSAHVDATARGDQAVSLANQYLGRPVAAGVSPPVVQKPTLQMVSDAVLQQESGGNVNVPPSIAGAQGRWQITPDTFARYAQPGQSMANPKDYEDVSQRAREDVWLKAQGDPARFAVGWFSGPGNIAPPDSPTPWLKDTADGTGKTVSSYVKDVSAKLGKANMLGGEAEALAKVDADWQQKDPKMAAAIRGIVSEQYRIGRMAQQSDALANQDQIDKVMRSTVDQVYANPTQDIEPILAAHPELNATQVEHLRNYKQQVLQQKLSGSSGDYGSGYSNVQSMIFDGRVRNQEQLGSFLGQPDGLSASGYNAALTLMNTVNAPGQESEKLLQKNFLDAAKKSVTRESDDGSFVIPGSQDTWNKALPVLTKGISDAKAKGMSPEEIYDPKNKNSVWNLVPKPDDKTVAGAIVDAATAPPPPEQTNASAWNTLMRYPPQGTNGQQFPKQAWAQALGMLLKDPTPENIKKFDSSKFGAAGFRGQELIDKLRLQKAPTANPTEQDLENIHD